MTIIQKLKIAAVKSPDLLHKRYNFDKNNPLAGHCYIMAEATFYVLKGLKPFVLRIGGDTHWFLKKGNKIVDPTYEQFEGEIIPYERGRGCGFLTRKPSKRAYELIKRANLLYRLKSLSRSRK